MRNYSIPILVFWLAILFAPALAAQNCGCVEEGNCPENIAPIQQSTVCYTFTDAFNNDLSDPNQGICGVNLSFSHDYLWDLELSLVAPSGQTLPLVGPDTMGTGGTLFTTWDVQFVPCLDTAEPDPGFSSVWNNAQSWPFVGAIGGSYYPVGGGCLEEFNFGAVNGQWCISINSESFTGGTLLDFEVILCDESGIFCCDADAGEINGGLEACLGESSLLIDIDPTYQNTIPDPMLYGYTYLISDINGLIVEATETPDLTTYSAGTYTICGLSYDLLEVGNLPLPDGILTIQDIRDDLDGLNPSICAQISSTCFPVTIYDLPLPFVLVDTICAGDNYMIGDSTFIEAGDYEVHFNSFNNCDSVVLLDLLVLTIDTGYINQTICLGDSLIVADSVFYTTGIFDVLVSDVSFCDSLYIVDLEVLQPIIVNVDASVCEGEEYPIGNLFYNQTGMYSDTLLAFSGCDSIINLDLEVLSLEAAIAFPDTITCAAPTVLLDGSASSNEVGTDYEWTTTNGSILPPNNMASIEVNSEGIYQLKITRAGCSDSISVSVFENNTIPIADAGLPDSITCEQPSLLLDGSNSTMTADVEYLWSTDVGSIPVGQENLLTPAITIAPATYTLTVSNPLTGCSAESSVLISLDTISPVADAGLDGILTCAIDTIFLDGSGSYIDDNYTYVWTDENTNILPETNIAESFTQVEGIFYFTITNLVSGCVGQDEMEVTINENVPVVDAGTTDTLTCLTTEIVLQGDVQNSVNYTILWTGNGIISNPTTLNPTIDTTGWFYLNILDIDNNCETIDSVFIEETRTPPLADASSVGSSILTCTNTSVTIGDVNNTSTGDEFIYNWYLNAAEISTDFPLIVANPGIYELVVENTTTGCLSNDSVEVVLNNLTPIASLGDDVTLNCSTPSVFLDGEELSPLPDDDDIGILDYDWYNAENDALVSFGEDSLFVTTTTAGAFYLVITNTINGCADTAYINVTVNANIPIADAGIDQVLNCATGVVSLDGTASSVGNYSYIWSGPADADITPPNTNTPTVNQAGTYTLQVTDNLLNCSSFDVVEVTIDTTDCIPFVEITPGFETFSDGINGIIDCLSPSNQLGLFIDTLDASGSDFNADNTTYEWTALSGLIFNEDNPEAPVVTEGQYVLTLTNTLFNISTSDTISVINIQQAPIANAGQNFTLICTDFDNGILVDGTNSAQGNQYEYLWTTEDGDFGDSDITSLTPTIFSPGFYEINVLDNTNGCVATDGALFNLLGQIPVPCIETEIQMECIDVSVTIGDTCAINNPTFTFDWSVIDGGEIIGTSTAPTIQVRTDTSMVCATFEVLITNTINNCTSTETVKVFTAVNCYPDCIVQTNPNPLTCLQDTVLLSGLGSSQGQQFSYQWQTIGMTGSFCGGENTLTPCVNAPGGYRLLVTNETTGFACQSPIVLVQEENDPPAVTIDETNNPAINCISDIVTLSATSTDANAYSFLWENTTNCILTDSTLPTIELDCEGIYDLTVTDLVTGCVAFSSANIAYDTVPPALAVISPPSAILDCTNSQVVLSGSGSSQGSYTWYRNDILLVNQTSLTYIANEAGEYCLVVTGLNNGCSTSTCITVMVDEDAIFSDAGDDRFLTCNGSSVTLTADAPTGAEFQYAWTTTAGIGCISGNSSSLSINANCAGTYTFMVTDFTNGCTGTSSVQVLDNTQPPQADAGQDRFLDCETSSTILDGSNSEQGDDLIYNWVGVGDTPNPIPSNSPTPTVTEGGLYTLLLFNEATFCFDIDSVFVESNTYTPVVDAGQDTILTCTTNQLFLSGQNSPQNDSLSYLWTSEQMINSNPTQLDILINQAGEYVLTITNDSTHCMEVDTVLVTIDTLPPLPSIIAENNSVLNCFQDTVSLDASISQPVGDLTFSWTPHTAIISPLDQATITVVSGGTYQVLLTDTSNGCSSQGSLNITQDFAPPTIDIETPETLTCAIESIQLDASNSQENVTFSWTGADPSILNPTSATPTVSMPGDYFLEVTSNDNGCSNIDSTIVNENIAPPTAVAQVGGTLDCIQTEVDLLGLGSSEGENYTYQWQSDTTVPNDTELNTIATEPGFYSILVTNADNGCQDSALVEVIATGFPITDILVSQENPNCSDPSAGSITIEEVVGGSAPYFFSFNGSVFSEYNYRNYLSVGDYTIQVEDIDGCEYSTSITIPDVPELVIDLGPDVELEIGDSLKVDVLTNLAPSQIDTIIWQPLLSEDCSICYEQTITPTETMNVFVEVIDINGCHATDNLFIYVVGGEESPIFVPTIFSPNGDGINDELIVFGKRDVEEINLFQIFDRWGTLVFEAQNFLPTDPAYSWDGSHRGTPLNAQVFAWRMEYTLTSSGKKVVIWGNTTLAR